MNCIPMVVLPVPGAPSMSMTESRGRPSDSISSRPVIPVFTRWLVNGVPPVQRRLTHSPDHVIDRLDPELTIITGSNENIDQAARIRFVGQGENLHVVQGSNV